MDGTVDGEVGDFFFSKKSAITRNEHLFIPYGCTEDNHSVQHFSRNVKMSPKIQLDINVEKNAQLKYWKSCKHWKFWSFFKRSNICFITYFIGS